MRSLYLSIAIAMLCTLSLSLAAFIMISDRTERTYLYPVFAAMDELELETARQAWSDKGAGALSAYLSRLDRLFGNSHHLLDARGTDIVSHRSLADLLPAPPDAQSRGFVRGRYVVTHRSQDGRLWFVSIGPEKGDRIPFVPYYVVVIAVAGALCLLAAFAVVLPIRRLTGVVERFGRGDLSLRAKARRGDEIGELARSFNEMADRLERLLLSERRLLQDISHELRSPLTRLKLAVKLARTSSDPGAALDRVERDIDRMSALTSEIVEMTRIEGEPSAGTFRPVGLSELVNEIVADCRAEAEARGCAIRVMQEFAGDVPGDRELLRRAVENVLRNAIRYAPEGTAVEVELSRDDAAVSIAIRDRGPGVPEESLGRIFEPFFRVEEARERSSGGVGLGLSIAKRIIDLHAGTIIAENANPGLKVRIRVPRHDAALPPASLS